MGGEGRGGVTGIRTWLRLYAELSLRGIDTGATLEGGLGTSLVVGRGEPAVKRGSAVIRGRGLGRDGNRPSVTFK